MGWVHSGATYPSVHPATIMVSVDEKAYNLSEVNIVGGPGEGIRRVQVITVNRNDALADFFEDLGPADAYTCDQFRVPSLWEHTVGELREIAWWLREHPFDPEKIVRTDLIKQLYDELEAKQSRAVGRVSYLVNRDIKTGG